MSITLFMDTFALNAIIQELQQQICFSKINAFRQPDKHSLIIGLWQRTGREYHLAISVAPQHQYLFLTSSSPIDPPLAFGKFLQHHIKGGEIQAIHKPLLERIITVEIVKKDIDGQALHFHLILEIMGRHSNLILVKQPTHKILDSIRHITAAQSSYRRIAPGAIYVPPPKQEKTDPRNMDQDQFQQLLAEYHTLNSQTETPSLPFWKFFLRRVEGFSPLLAKEVAGYDHSDDEARWQRFSSLVEIIVSGTYHPHIILEKPHDGKQYPAGLSAFPLETRSCTPVDSINQAADAYYTALTNRQRCDALKHSLLSHVNRRLTKLYKKREHLLTQKAKIEDAEQHKRHGELLTTHLYQLKKGMREAEITNYYAEGQPLIKIPLDPKLTPSQNAQRYFKRYNKLKQGQEVTTQRFQETENLISSLEERKFFIEDADTIQQLEALQAELEEIETPIRKKPSHPKTIQKRSTPFLRFISSDGFDIYVGRSSKENDLLTQRTAVPDDLWLHAHRVPGSHVLVLHRNRNVPIPEQTLIEAASLAAYYSKSRNSGKVDVIYTTKRYVKKPKGSPAGLVTVSQSQTIRVSPQAEIAAKK